MIMKEETRAESTENGAATKDVSIEVNETIQAKMPGDASTYFSRVNDIRESNILIAWPTSRGVRMALHPAQTIELVFVRNGSPYSIAGSILEATSDPLPQVVVRSKGPPRKIQRRQDFRVKCMMPVQITGTMQEKPEKHGEIQSAPIFIQTVTYDLSAGGLSIRHATAIPEETVIEVKLKLPDGGPEIKLPARIAYSGSIPGNGSLFHLGVDYLAISEWEQARIIRCLYRIQLASLRG